LDAIAATSRWDNDTYIFVGGVGFLVKIRGKTGGRIMEIQKERRMIS